jgi:hypothetical protein
MLTRPRCAHCYRLLMLGEDWHEAEPGRFYCEAHGGLAPVRSRLLEMFELDTETSPSMLVPAFAY